PNEPNASRHRLLVRSKIHSFRGLSAMFRFAPATRLVLLAVAATTLMPPAARAQSKLPPLTSLVDAQVTGATSGDAVRRLTIDDAVKMALEQNLGIRVQRIDPQIQDVGIAQARSYWAPTLLSNFSRNSQIQRSTSIFSGGAASVDNGTVST